MGTNNRTQPWKSKALVNLFVSMHSNFFRLKMQALHNS